MASVTKCLQHNKQCSICHVTSMRKEDNTSPLHRVKGKNNQYVEDSLSRSAKE